MLQEIAGHDPHLVLVSKTRNIVHQIAPTASFTNVADRPGRPAPWWLAEAVAFVHANFRGTIRVDDVARAAGMHPAHLRAVFRDVHCVSIGRYIRWLRVEWAASRLAVTEEPISTIAAAAGFADQPHLTRWFVRLIGSTPAAYRQALRRQGRSGMAG